MNTLQSLAQKVNIRLYPGKLMYNPDWLVLGVNNICNLHCKMCDVGTQFTGSNFYANLMGARPVNMPLDLITKIIQQSARYFPHTKIGYAFTEPLIYPHLTESLSFANDHGIYTTITTNALTLKQKAGALADAGLNEIFISLDGPENIHNQIRGHKNAFNRAVAGIDALLGTAQPPKISIFCCITEWNIGHLKAFADSFRDYPLKQLGFMHTNFTGKEQVNAHNNLYGEKYPATESSMEDIDLGAMDLHLLWQERNAIKQESYPFEVLFSPELDSPEMMEIFYYHPDILIGKRCNDVFRNILIKSDGTVIPAHGRCYNLTLGNVYDEGLPEIWNSSVAAQFRKDLLKAGGLMPACSRCCSAF